MCGFHTLPARQEGSTARLRLVPENALCTRSRRQGVLGVLNAMEAPVPGILDHLNFPRLEGIQQKERPRQFRWPVWGPPQGDVTTKIPSNSENYPRTPAETLPSPSLLQRNKFCSSLTWSLASRVRWQQNART